MPKVFALVLLLLFSAASVGVAHAALSAATTAPIALAAAPIRPRKLRLKEAVRYSGISRSVLYELAPRYRGLFTKQGTSTLVDVTILDQILDAQPVAEIKG
jgi:hypothetical protein